MLSLWLWWGWSWARLVDWPGRGGTRLRASLTACEASALVETRLGDRRRGESVGRVVVVVCSSCCCSSSSELIIVVDSFLVIGVELENVENSLGILDVVLLCDSRGSK